MFDIEENTLIIDCGHAINTPGKCTPKYEDGSVTKEAEQNYIIGSFLELAAIKCGFQTFMTNRDISEDLDSNSSIALNKRISLVNDYYTENDILVSLHKNATLEYKWNEVRGTETYIYKFGGEEERIAKHVHDNVIRKTKDKDRGLKLGNHLAIVRDTKPIALLLELGFMTNLEDAKDMTNTEACKLYAESLIEGLCNALGVIYQPIIQNVPDWAAESYTWACIEGLEDGILSTDEKLKRIELQSIHRLYKYHQRFR